MPSMSEERFLEFLLTSACSSEACADALDDESVWRVVRWQLGRPTVEAPAPVLEAA